MAKHAGWLCAKLFEYWGAAVLFWEVERNLNIGEEIQSSYFDFGMYLVVILRLVHVFKPLKRSVYLPSVWQSTQLFSLRWSLNRFQLIASANYSQAFA